MVEINAGPTSHPSRPNLGQTGISLAWGGAGTNYISNAVGIGGDFIVWYPEQSTASPVASQIRLGDLQIVALRPP